MQTQAQIPACTCRTIHAMMQILETLSGSPLLSICMNMKLINHLRNAISALLSELNCMYLMVTT